MKITTQQYVDAIKNTLSESQIQLLDTLSSFPYSTASSKDLAFAMNYKSSRVSNIRVGQTGKKIANYLKITPPSYYDGKKKKPAYFAVIGNYDTHAVKKTESVYGWKMTKNLLQAIKIFKKTVNHKTDTHYYVQYHNADKLGYYPTTNLDFNISAEKRSLDAYTRYEKQMFTSKKLVNAAVGQFCFLIVGKTETIKQYYLWSFFKIEEVKKDKNNFYQVYGSGFKFKKPVLLNNLDNFHDFMKYCGNFGIGFQKINSHSFTSTLLLYTTKNKSKTNVDRDKNQDKNDLLIALQQLNKKMQLVSPERRLSSIDQILRKDKEIVGLLKKVAGYKCQFPNCKSVVKMTNGSNYVEVAHIKPVHKGGKSIIGNMIVLCPNHHKEFDYGDLKTIKQTKKLLVGELNGKFFKISCL
jgi:hypothetical protein